MPERATINCTIGPALFAARRPMASWTHSTGLGNELVLREERLDLPADLHEAARASTLHIAFVFDRQARPHVILSCKALTSLHLGVARDKPSFWDLPHDLQAMLLKRQLTLANELNAMRCEVHLGSWVSSRSIHAHIILPLMPFFQLRADMLKQPSWTAADAERRAHYVNKVTRDRNRYHKQDAREALEAVTSGASQLIANFDAFDGVVFDAEETGTPSIDITFKGAPVVKAMDHGQLCAGLQAVQSLCAELRIDGAHLLLPAPAVGEAGMAGAHQERVVRIVCVPKAFVLCLPPERRQIWYAAYKTASNPSACAYKEDLSLLDLKSGGDSSVQEPKRPKTGTGNGTGDPWFDD
jgi:hypothetical protein